LNSVNNAGYWDAIYRERSDGWDLRGPTPVFRRLAESGQFPPGRMLVPGAGRGHDARLFARHGFRVTAVDFAEEAVREMTKIDDLLAPVEVLRADLFALPPAFDSAFDYVLDYTCLCAIDPARRPEFADVVTRVLAPGGHFIALAFPIRETTGGPPFSVSPDEYIALFTARGFALRHRESPPDSIRPRKGFEELLIFRAGGSSAKEAANGSQ